MFLQEVLRLSDLLEVVAAVELPLSIDVISTAFDMNRTAGSSDHHFIVFLDYLVLWCVTNILRSGFVMPGENRRLPEVPVKCCLDLK